jgi:hypothetical protein
MISGLERSLIWTISVALVMVGMYVGSLSSAVETSRDEIDRLRSTPERLARIETELMHLRTSVDGLATVMDAHRRK